MTWSLFADDPKIRRTERVIFYTALAVRAVAFLGLVLLAASGRLEFPIDGTDSHGYAMIVENIREHGVFSRSSAPPFIPDSFRTPGYPLFALVVSSVLGVYGVVWVQYLLAAYMGILLWRVARTMMPDRYAKVIALLFVVEPIGIYLSSVWLSETLFTFLILLALSWYIGRMPAWIVGVTLGVAILVRPVGMVLIPLFTLLFLLERRRRGIRDASVCVLVCFLVLVPWMMRSFLVFGTPSLSRVNTHNLYSYHASLFYAQKNNISHNDALAVFHARLKTLRPEAMPGSFTFADVPALRKVALDVIWQDPVEFAFFYLKSTVPFFVTDGWSDIVRRVGITDDTGEAVTRSDNMVNVLASRSLVFWCGFIFWICIACLAFSGIVAALYHVSYDARMLAFFAVSVIFFLAIASGTVANGRLRYPATPFLFLLAGFGASVFGRRVVRHLLS